MRRSVTQIAVVLVSTLLLAKTLPAFAVESAASPALGISITPDRINFEVGEWVHCGFEITNLSAEAILLPEFHLRGKISREEEDQQLVKAQVLRVRLSHDNTLVVMNPWWEKPPEHPGEYSVVALQPGQAVRKRFCLIGYGVSLFTVTNPGLYTVSIALDTRGLMDTRIPKGIWSSAPTTFLLAPYPAFRARKLEESAAAYAEARVGFYLWRRVQRQGAWDWNNHSILCTEGSGAALIQFLDSQEPGMAHEARALLEMIHHPEDGREHPPTPTTKEGWKDWWKETGSKLSARELIRNIASRIQ